MQHKTVNGIDIFDVEINGVPCRTDCLNADPLLRFLAFDCCDHLCVTFTLLCTAAILATQIFHQQSEAVGD